MQRYLIYTGIPIAVSNILSILFVYIRKNNKSESTEELSDNHIVVTLPKMYLVIGCIDILFFGICIFLSILKPNGTATVWVWIEFGIFMLLGAVIVWVTVIWKIDIFRNENYFIYRTAFGNVLKIRYDECKQYELKENTMILKTVQKNLYMDMFAKNSDVFLSILRQNNVKRKKKNKS